MKPSRRAFLTNASLGASALGLSSLMPSGRVHATTARDTRSERRPREVWIAAMTQHLIGGDTLDEVTASALRQMGNALPFSPDIICLPEVFHVVGLKGGRQSLQDSAEDGSGRIIGPYQEFARKSRCHVICPIYTTEDGKYYNAAVVLDRSGAKLGEYRKIRLTEGEFNSGLSPGPLDPPVFATDFGLIGIQICFDIHWPEGWRCLAEKGAEIVFWPSAFGGGKMVNAKAWENSYCVVSSTRKGTTKICEITGEEVAASGQYDKWGICAPLNLEKIFLHTWPYSRNFPTIQKKYGRKVRIHTLHEEEFSVIESMSADVKIADLVREFGLKTHREHIRSADELRGKLGFKG